MADLLRFRKGSFANLPTDKVAGTIYVTTDEQAMYVDVDNSTRIRLGDIIQIDTYADFKKIAPPYSEKAIYYIIDENALLKYRGVASGVHQWQQINSTSDIQGAIDSLKTEVQNNTTAISTLNIQINGNGTSDTGLVGRIEDVEKQINGDPAATDQDDKDGILGRLEKVEDVADVNKTAIGDTSDTANASGSIYARIKKNAEDIKTNADNINNNASAIGVNAAGIKTNADAITALDGRVTTVEGKVSTLESEMDTAQSDISTLKTDVKKNADDIDALGDSLADLSTDVGLINAQVTTNTTDITNLKTTVADHTTAIGQAGDPADASGSLYARIKKNAEDIAKNAQNIATNASKISGLETTINDLSGTVSQLDLEKVDKTDYEADKKALEEKIDAEINAANAMTYKGVVNGPAGDVSATAPLPTTEVKIGDTYIASTGFTVNNEQVFAGDLLVANGTEDVVDPTTGETTIGASLTWEVVNTGYIESHENQLLGINNQIQLQSYIGTVLSAITFAGDGAAKVTVDANKVNVSVEWEDF